MGNLWADFQIVNFEQNSQPLYVMVDPGSEQVLTQPRPFKEGIKGYQDFLIVAGMPTAAANSKIGNQTGYKMRYCLWM